MASASRVKIPKATLIKELEKEQEKAEKKFTVDLEKWEQEKATYNERLASGLEKEAARVRKMNGKLADIWAMRNRFPQLRTKPEAPTKHASFIDLLSMSSDTDVTLTVDDFRKYMIGRLGCEK